VCIAFMHRKSGGFSRVHLKHKVIEVSLVSMELRYVIDTSAISFDMTFVNLLRFRGKQFEFKFKYGRQNSNKILNWNLNSKQLYKCKVTININEKQILQITVHINIITTLIIILQVTQEI
jgi:hypothetical protein